MRVRPAVIDTNVLVAGLLTSEPTSPTACILDGMLAGSFPFLLSVALLAEYRAVLLRPAIARRHRRSEAEIDTLLAEIALNAIVREPGSSDPAPDPGDQHLWDLFGTQAEAILVTGDDALRQSAPRGASAVSPAGFVELLGARPAEENG